MIAEEAPAVIHAARRFASYRRRRRWAIVFALGLLLTLGASGYVLSVSQLVSLRELQISLKLNSTSRLTRAQLVSAANVPIGRALIRINPGQVQRNIAALPAVRSVTVRRSWPHTLEISVVARRAEVELKTLSGIWLADSSGVVFASGATRGVTVVNLGSARLGVRRLPWQIAAHTSASLASVPPDLRSAATGFRIQTGQLRFRIGRTVVLWGGPAGASQKVAEVRALLSATARKRYATIDVSTPGVVVTRMRKSKAQSSSKPPTSP